jgi:NapC/NirT cytochrome c family, N-terminal region
MNAPRPSRALLRHPLAIAGALIATTSAVIFVALLIAALTGLFNGPYAGLVVFVGIPGLFIAGLALVPVGMWLQSRRLRRDPTAGADWPVVDFRIARVRRISLVVIALAALNLIVLLVAGYGSLHWMETPQFCGQVCHTPMTPQFTAWQHGAHAKIACATCHVGEGARGFVHAKLNGVHQLVAVTTRSFARPIPPGAVVPVGGHDLTCGRCHQPGRIPGDVVRVIRTYGDDEKNTESITALMMHVGRGSSSGRSIHWHADSSVRVEYAYTDTGRQTIPYVRVTRANGQMKEFFASDAGHEPAGEDKLRRMDCVDCHNMVGHRIFPTAEQAVDQALAGSVESRRLPFARRESVRVLNASYSGEGEAMQGIARGLRSFYEAHPGSDPAAIDKTVAALQEVYRHNVFPVMKVTWGTYPDNTGHSTSAGCFRCHDGSHTAKDGSTISGDCEFCHKQIEF